MCVFFYLIVLLSNVMVVFGRKQGLLVIPGLGRMDRLDTVVTNLKALEPFLIGGTDSLWDCVVYTYAPREFIPVKGSNYFWGATDTLKYVKGLCDIIENPGKYVIDHLHMVAPALLRLSYQYIFVLLDDCRITSTENFDLLSMIAIMEENKLSMASPRVVNANKGGGQKFRDIMQAPPPAHSPGYVSSFIEVFAVIMTHDGYQALWELLCPEINPYGWGYDMWYHNYAKSRILNHKMGIVSKYFVKHEQVMVEGMAKGRSDQTNVSVKWKALIDQERYYQHHYGTRLHRFRETLPLKNLTFLGPVMGLLRLPPVVFVPSPVVPIIVPLPGSMPGTGTGDKTSWEIDLTKPKSKTGSGSSSGSGLSQYSSTIKARGNKGSGTGKGTGAIDWVLGPKK